MKRKISPLVLFFALFGLFKLIKEITLTIAEPPIQLSSNTTNSSNADPATDDLAIVAPRSEIEERSIDIYKKTSPSVVNILTRAEVYDFWRPSVAEGSGSGLIIDAKNGYIVTNYHVVSGANIIRVVLFDGKTYPAKIRGVDPDTDLALIQITGELPDSLPNGLIAATLGTSSNLEVGQQVLAIGNPFGLDRTLSLGIISSKGRTIRTQNGRLIEDVIQIDASINPGNSGGPLLDMAGRVVGINTAILSRSGDSAGIGLSIPIDRVKWAVPMLIEKGRVLRPKIGVVVEDTEIGPVFSIVDPEGPAGSVGVRGYRYQVRRGNLITIINDFDNADFIISVDGKKVNSKADVIDLMSKAREGKEIEFELRQGLSPVLRTRVVKVVPKLG